MRAPEPPPLTDELETLLRRLRLPHIRRAAPEVIATARAQRWEPAEVLKALFIEELTGRERSALATRRKAAAFPDGQDLRGLGADVIVHSGPHPVVAADARVGEATGEPGGVRTVGDGQDLLLGGPWTDGRRGRA